MDFSASLNGIYSSNPVLLMLAFLGHLKLDFRMTHCFHFHWHGFMEQTFIKWLYHIYFLVKFIQ